MLTYNYTPHVSWVGSKYMDACVCLCVYIYTYIHTYIYQVQSYLYEQINHSLACSKQTVTFSNGLTTFALILSEEYDSVS